MKYHISDIKFQKTMDIQNSYRIFSIPILKFHIERLKYINLIELYIAKINFKINSQSEDIL